MSKKFKRMLQGVVDVMLGRILQSFFVGMLGMCLISLTACGQSGPLYLPGQTPPIKTIPCDVCP